MENNYLDELIKQLGAEKEVITPVEEPLENIIFNPRLFNTNEKLTKLKNAMKAFIEELIQKNKICKR